jgi:hypothetical protein
MNYGRLALAAVVGTVVDAAYGLGVYGTLLRGEFSAYPAVYRPEEAGAAYMPFLFLGTFLAMCAAAYIFAKGYEGGKGVQEGGRFGATLGVFAAGYASLVNYATLNIGSGLGMMMAAAAWIEWLIAGMVIGLVYVRMGAGVRSRRAVGV